jgi:hypothetical protein
MVALGKFGKKFRMLETHKENYEINPKFCKQKGIQL